MKYFKIKNIVIFSITLSLTTALFSQIQERQWSLDAALSLENGEAYLFNKKLGKIAFYNLGKGKITAPFSGVVLHKHTQLGELQTPGSVVLTVAALEKNWVVKTVLTGDENRLSLIHAIGPIALEGGFLASIVVNVCSI